MQDYFSLNDDYSLDLYDRSEDGYFDVPFDTEKGTSKGFDVFIRSKYAKQNTFSIAYSYSKSRITYKAGVPTARNLDRIHSISINKIFKFKNQGTVSAASYFTSFFRPAKLIIYKYKQNISQMTPFKY